MYLAMAPSCGHTLQRPELGMSNNTDIVPVIFQPQTSDVSGLNEARVILPEMVTLEQA